MRLCGFMMMLLDVQLGGFQENTIYFYHIQKEKLGHLMVMLFVSPILEASKERYESERVIGGRSYIGGKSARIGKIPEDVWKIPVV